ncbi:hypothetical protein M1M38_gp110 [Halorubrum tailed virus 27]|uniref:Uncharacterized protein n=1 Tax=Halorubrum tailed virus 27 TaxID=2878008 RepID=A0AAE9BZ05_9CAUD|nr:hypothetical protein M1M38_gp110 [Halorubrum tailed virus 27]UBF22803.1 hypothetical protein HRTV-27_gp110 [Halorubrum tailed virus 27]
MLGSLLTARQVRPFQGPEPFGRYECSKVRRARGGPGLKRCYIVRTFDPGIGPDPSTLSDRVSGSGDDHD